MIVAKLDEGVFRITLEIREQAMLDNYAKTDDRDTEDFIAWLINTGLKIHELTLVR